MEDFDKRLTVRGGVALLAALVINRFGVVLMRYSGSGIGIGIQSKGTTVMSGALHGDVDLSLPGG